MASKLDKIKEDWYERINLNEFGMKMCGSCVLGQAFPERHINAITTPYFIKEIGWELSALGWLPDQYGDSHEEYYAKLERYWEKLINQRRKND